MSIKIINTIPDMSEAYADGYATGVANARRDKYSRHEHPIFNRKNGVELCLQEVYDQLDIDQQGQLQLFVSTLLRQKESREEMDHQAMKQEMLLLATEKLKSVLPSIIMSEISRRSEEP